MFRVVLCALLVPVANAQLTTYFVSGTVTLGPYHSIGITVCNGTSTVQTQTAFQLQQEAAGQGILLATNSQLLAAVKQAEERSWQRNVLLGIEIASWFMAAATAGELIKIEERYKAAFPLAAGGLRFATTVIKPNQVEIPPTRPTVLQIAAGSCEELTVFGKVRGK